MSDMLTLLRSMPNHRSRSPTTSQPVASGSSHPPPPREAKNPRTSYNPPAPTAASSAPVAATANEALRHIRLPPSFFPRTVGSRIGLCALDLVSAMSRIWATKRRSTPRGRGRPPNAATIAPKAAKAEKKKAILGGRNPAEAEQFCGE
ncbi:hypothetical protein M413DRAFT_22172 [Hebeloma cylindrosporum]|uniref:Uncharacterized protein n=1 Tax=Hebeloma cylindrosporum TaxID=76867 RepID=A0A0C2YCG0_HEBCY|nr:hypothetical protein M413DRAFT_22172 [Hebeloma cylindrosporum h7]